MDIATKRKLVSEKIKSGEGVNVLSLFDGISCGILALKNEGIPIHKYYSSEIDASAIAISENNHPEIIRLGDVRTVKGPDLEDIDIILCGSPCQGFSFGGSLNEFDDPRSKLFFEFIRLLGECNPAYFFFENVPMRKASKSFITDLLGVRPFDVKSDFCSAQNRLRSYWTNISDSFDFSKIKDLTLSDVAPKGLYPVNYSSSSRPGGIIEGRFYITDKSHTLTATGFSNRSHTGFWNISGDTYQILQAKKNGKIFRINGRGINFKKNIGLNFNLDGLHFKFKKELEIDQIEWIQGVPRDYTAGVSNRQRIKALGNGWNVPTIQRFLEKLK